MLRVILHLRYIERVTSVSGKIASEVPVRGDGSVAGERKVDGLPKFQLKLDVQRFLWPVYYISYIITLYYAGPKLHLGV